MNDSSERPQSKSLRSTRQAQGITTSRANLVHRIAQKCHRASNVSARALTKVEGWFPKKQFRFTDLPGELRNAIYEYALILDPHIEINPSFRYKSDTLRTRAKVRECQRYYRKKLAIGLLRTCRVISQEARVVLYGKNHFESNHLQSWLQFERWILQIGDNVKYLDSARVSWPSSSTKPHNEENFGSRTFMFLHPILSRSYGGLPQAAIDERIDDEAFQRVCNYLAKKDKLEVLRLWAWRGKIHDGFNTITFFRAVIVPAILDSVKLADLKVAVDEDGTLLDSVIVDNTRHWAIQVERYRCFRRDNKIRDSLEVVNYYVPTAISVASRSRRGES